MGFGADCDEVKGRYEGCGAGGRIGPGMCANSVSPSLMAQTYDKIWSDTSSLVSGPAAARKYLMMVTQNSCGQSWRMRRIKNNAAPFVSSGCGLKKSCT